MPNQLVGVRRVEAGEHRQCQHIDIVSWPSEIFKGQHEEHQCGQDSEYVVTQIGELTGKKFNKYVCMYHALPYLRVWTEGNGTDAKKTTRL